VTVPSSLVSALVAPIREVQALVGTGWAGSDDAAAALAEVRDALDDVSDTGRRAWQQTGAEWSGAGADAAAEFSRATVTAVEALSIRVGHLGATAARAADAVALARVRLQTIVEAFEARAAALEADLGEPGVADALIEEGRRALEEANAVVDGLRAELDAQAAAVTAPPLPAPETPAATTPAAAPSGWSGGSGSGVGAPSLGTPGLGAAGGGGVPSGHDLWSQADVGVPAGASSDPAVFGEGVGVTLPDGSTATAPNAVAASAVRHALTQLGVPYHWGGTTPGVSLDCSGLTQWAYREAGLDLPRLAQEQDVGAAVDRGALRPGDLAVWDGHVAMIVGNGLMIEAGDPVKLSPIRTTNAGQGFQGFWRPTA
jgi:cell wall-associated NlpC family hydrolase